MGLYDTRLAQLSEPRLRVRRVAQHRSLGPALIAPRPLPALRPDRGRPRLSPAPARRPAAGPVSREPTPALAEARRAPMRVQSLLFNRGAGWTESKAKAWASSHIDSSTGKPFKHAKADVTDQYVRIRQFPPKGSKVTRTITLGDPKRGIRAVVAREENMPTTAKETRRPRRRSKKTAPAEAPRKSSSRRRTRTRASEAWRGDKAGHSKAAKKGWRKRKKKGTAKRKTAEVAAPRRRRAAAPAGYVMESSRRRSRPRASEAWRGDKAGHSKAAKKGWAKRRRSKRTREAVYETRPRRRSRPRAMAYETRPRSRSRSRSRSATYESRPRRSRPRRTREVLEARPRRRYRSSEARRTSGGGVGEYVAELSLAVLFGGLGFVLADGLDRYLATYDPSSTAAKPTDKFTSDGAGTLANTLNIAQTPSMLRVAAGVGATALPAVASVFIDQPLIKASLEGAAVGAGVSLFKTVWNNVIMPLLKPKDTSTTGLQKSIIARLYPAEIAASINLAQQPPQTAASGTAFGALSQPPAGYQPQAQLPSAGVGAPADVGPFALSEQYPTAVQARQQQTGVRDGFPSLQNVWGTAGPGSDYPTAAQALRQEAGLGDVLNVASDAAKAVQAAIPSVSHEAAIKAVGHAVATPHDIVGALQRALPGVSPAALAEVAKYVHGHVMRLHGIYLPLQARSAQVPAPLPSPPVAAAQISQAALTPSVPVAGVSAPASRGNPGQPGMGQSWQPGPPPGPGPGPQAQPHTDPQCGCVGDDNQFLGFIGDGEEDTLFSDSNGKAA